MNENIGTPFHEKPGMVTAIAVMTLVNGIINIIWGFSFSIGAVSTIIGICATPLTILPTVLGIFEIVYAAKLLSNSPQAVRPNQTLAIFEILMILAGNIFSTVVGALVLVFYADLNVKQYFAWLNGEPLPPVPVTPAALPETLPAVPAPAAPEAPAAPQKATPKPRKVASKSASKPNPPVSRETAKKPGTPAKPKSPGTQEAG
ncbi:MAG: hypothetical protein JXA13_13495 [Anaerolineales bacterium]|nr:hypothetical protein [Anaerolineales bacterium]